MVLVQAMVVDAGQNKHFEKCNANAVKNHASFTAVA